MDQMKQDDSLTIRKRESEFGSDPASGRTGLENLRDTVAGKLHSAAEVIQEKASQNQNSQIGNYAGQAGKWLDDAAGYVQEANPEKMKSDLQNQVRRNPGRSLLVAGAAGLLLGFLIRR